MSTPLLTVLEESLDWTGKILAGIAPEQHDTPTPCPDLPVDGLVAHVMDGLNWYAHLPAGGPTDPRGQPGSTPPGTSYVEAFGAARAAIRRNWTPEHLTATYPMPIGDTVGEVTGAGMTEYLIVEVLVHGWDLAIATGQPIDVPPDLAETTVALAHGLGEGVLRAPGMMGAERTVPADAPAIDRLVAFLGRSPEAVKPVWRGTPPEPIR